MQKAASTILGTLLSVFGALWLIVEVTSFFAEEENATRIQGYWYVFLTVGVAISVVRLWPKNRFCFLVYDRDVSVEITVGDIFKQDGPIVIGSNTRFETNPAYIAENSIQGKFVSQCCSDLKSVNQQIESQTSTLPVNFGTTVTVRGKSRIGYFCAVAEMNQSGIAGSTLENLRLALGGLWAYVSESAEKSIINVPILGSGYSRVSASREELVREIVLSFMAAIAEKTFCDGIRIVVHSKDLRKYNIEIEELAKFIEYNCRYAISRPHVQGGGTEES